MSDRDWLAKLKVGDKVLIQSGRSLNHYREATVDKVGKIHIVVGGSKFRLSDGGRVGEDCWTFTCIVPHNESLVAEQQAADEKAAIETQLRYYDWRKVPLAALRAIAALLPGKDGDA